IDVQGNPVERQLGRLWLSPWHQLAHAADLAKALRDRLDLDRRRIEIAYSDRHDVNSSMVWLDTKKPWAGGPHGRKRSKRDLAYLAFNAVRPGKGRLRPGRSGCLLNGSAASWPPYSTPPAAPNST